MSGNEIGTCRICGKVDKGLLFTEWVKLTFTDFDKLQSGDIICHACQFCFDERSELLAQRVGKDKPQRMRNYSHFVVGGEWIPLSKANKAKMRELLLYKSEVAIIATSGQKHIIFRAQPGWWQIEEHSAQPFPEMLERLLHIVEALYTTFSKSEIQSGDYAQYRIMRFGLREWHALEAQIAPWRGSQQLELALFLAQRKEIEDDTTSQGSGRPARNHLEGNSTRLQEPLSDEHLATIRGPDTISGVHEQPRKVHQLTLL